MCLQFDLLKAFNKLQGLIVPNMDLMATYNLTFNLMPLRWDLSVCVIILSNILSIFCQYFTDQVYII